MKDNSTSERKLLELSPNITFVDGLASEKFSFQMTDQEKADHDAKGDQIAPGRLFYMFQTGQRHGTHLTLSH